ncbi:MAG: hypothetical protein GMKNLPBB_01258 [Myxococcota bacterium]|nr:hypothetical protein [Myxococcota bacterium]
MTMSKFGLFVLAAVLFVCAGHESALASSPGEDAEFHTTRGFLRRQEGDHAGAVEDLTFALKNDPANHEVKEALGLSKIQIKQYREGADLLHQALAANAERKNLLFPIGYAQFQTKDYAAAEATLTKSIEAEPDNAQAHLYRGAALYHLKKDADALAALDRAGSMSPGLEGTASYYKGLILARMGKKDEARDNLRRTAESMPGTPAAASANRVLSGLGVEQKAPPEQKGEKALPLAAAAVVSYQYDSNVILQSNDESLAPLYQNIANKGGSKTIVNLLLDATPIRTARATVGAVLSGYMNFHFDTDLDNFNFTTFSAGPYGTWKISDKFNLRLPYMFSYSLIGTGFNGFGFNHAVNPSLTWTAASWTVGRLQIGNRYDGFFAPPATRIPPPQRRDAYNLSPGWTQYFGFKQGRYILSVGYVFEFNAADGDDWDYLGHQGQVGGIIKIIEPLRLRANAGVIYRNFGNPQSGLVGGANETRNDTIIQAGASLAWHAWNDNLIVTAGYAFNKGDSSLALFKFDRHLITAGVTLAY